MFGGLLGPFWRQRGLKNVGKRQDPNPDGLAGYRKPVKLTFRSRNFFIYNTEKVKKGQSNMRDPRIYLRHPRGRGKVYGDAEVSLSAYLSVDSVAAQSCQVRDCSIINESYVAEDARMFGGTAEHSYLGGDIVVAGNPWIKNSIVRGRSITGRPELEYVSLFDSAEVADYAFIIGESIDKTVVIKDNALVYGDCRLLGAFTIGGKMRVSTGTWKRAPRYVDLGFVGVTESKLGAMVDCRDRTYDYWMKHGPKLAKRWGWNEQQILMALAAVSYVVKGD